MRVGASVIFFVAALLVAGATWADEPADRPALFHWQDGERGYILHIPAGSPASPMPLVIALHGAGGNAAAFAAETHFGAAADATHMLVVFPDGTENAPGSNRRSWNARFCCGTAIVQEIDDIGFIGALIEHISAQDHVVDRSRVYATGMSNGGMMSYQLAAAHPEWFAAIAPVSATIGGMMRNGEVFVIRAASRPVPVMIIHGRKDAYVMFNGGSSPRLSFPYRWKLSVADALSFWAAIDGCQSPPDESEAVAGVLERVAYRNCQGGSEIVAWEIEQGDHSWPDDLFPGPDGQKRSAAAEIMAFFAAHRSE
jgi:polyhydroxybutyrate depolymerase